MKLALRIKLWFQSLLATLGVSRRPCSVYGLSTSKQKHFVRVRKMKNNRHKELPEYAEKIRSLEKELKSERLDNVLTMNSIMIGYEEQLAEQKELILAVQHMLESTLVHQTPALVREKYSHNYFNKSIEEIVKTINTYMSKKGSGL
jgi:hypothetical protein